MPNKVSVVIVHWQDFENLKSLAKNLVNQENIELIIVDNHSPDFKSDNLTKMGVKEIIVNPTNQGFAFACNLGAAQAKGDHFLFLNPDVEIKPTQIQAWLDFHQYHQLDASSPRPANSNYAQPLPSPIRLALQFSPLQRFHQLFASNKTLTGGALLINKNVFNEINGFDERFWLWFEDSDLSQRLQIGGYRTGWWHGEIKHIGGSSIKKLSSIQQKHIFFHSMKVHANKHFGSLGQTIVGRTAYRFSQLNLLSTDQHKMSIVVPNLKEELLHNFLLQNWPILKTGLGEGNLELIVVSSDINHKFWNYKRKYSQVRFIPLANNRGFAQTVNIGLRAATGHWLATVNDDVTLPPNWWQDLISQARPTTGSLNPVIVSPEGQVESAGIQILPQGRALPITQIPGAPSSVDATNGACVIYRRQALEQVGLFDERFGSYLEDIDLSLRLQRAGWQNLLVPSVSVVHTKHATSRKTLKPSTRAWLNLKNWWLVILKNWPARWWLQYLPQILIERGRNLSGWVKSII